MSKVKIIVATHKKYQMPKSDLYLPLHVGKKNQNYIGYTGDDTGRNISAKNPYFCELTGLYWAWKNIDFEYIGLVHYRRHFRGKAISNNIFDKVLSYKEVNTLLKNADVILPKKRKYYIETLYSHYKHTMYIEPLDITGDIIKELYPDYNLEFKRLKTRTKAHMFNMFIMKKEILDEYCNWLFGILFELERRIDSSIYDDFHSRFYGRISELLLDVWLNVNKIRFEEVPLLNIEKTNWFKKGFSFLRAKFFGKKYEKSF